MIYANQKAIEAFETLMNEDLKNVLENSAAAFELAVRDVYSQIVEARIKQDVSQYKQDLKLKAAKYAMRFEVAMDHLSVRQAIHIILDIKDSDD